MKIRMLSKTQGLYSMTAEEKIGTEMVSYHIEQVYDPETQTVNVVINNLTPFKNNIPKDVKERLTAKFEQVIKEF